MPVTTIGLIAAGGGLLGKAISRAQSNTEMRKLLANQPKYQENPLYAKNYALAQSMYNAQMPGTQTYLGQLERSRSSEIAAAERAGQNSMLAAAAAAAQANQASEQLAGQQAAWKQQAYGGLTASSQALAEEQRRVYEDKLRQYENQAQIQGAIQQNRAATFGDITNAGFGLATFGAQNPGIFGKGSPINALGTPPPGTITTPNASYAPGTYKPNPWAYNWLNPNG